MLMNRKRLAIFATLILVLIIIVFGISMAWTKVMNTRRYVYCELIRPGMTKQEVDSALQPYGPYYEPGSDHTYYFLHVRANNDRLTQYAVGHMTLLYDDKGVLKGAAREVSLGDWGEGYNCNETPR